MCRKCVVLLFIFSTVAQGFAICKCEGGFHPGVDPSIGVPRQTLTPRSVCGQLPLRMCSLPPDPVVVIGLSAKNYGHLPIEMIIFWHLHVFCLG